MRWLRQAGEADSGSAEALGDLEQLMPRDGPAVSGSSGALMALASLAGLRLASPSAGALGGWGASRPLGVGLSAALLLWFFLSRPPGDLSREAYLALGLLATALPLLILPGSLLRDRRAGLQPRAGAADRPRLRLRLPGRPGGQRAILAGDGAATAVVLSAES